MIDQPLLKKLIHRSLDEHRTERTFKLYKEGKISFGKAAELAEKTLWEMIDLMKKYDVYFKYSIEDSEKELKNLEDFR